MIPWRRILLAVIGIPLAVTLELVVLSRLHLPGATPDLVTVAVVILALLGGPGFGAGVGFVAGLAIDLAPPADGTVGIMALVLTVTGFIVGSTSVARDRSLVPSILVAGFACPATLAVSTFLGALLGSSRVRWEEFPMMLGTTLIYGLLLGAAIIPPLWLLLSKADLSGSSSGSLR